MLPTRALLKTCMLASVAVVASANSYDSTNPALRPKRIDGLFYHLYASVGSYYNGTTSIVIEPGSFVANTTCDTFTNGTVTIRYPNSVLGLIKSDLEYWSDDISKAEPLGFELNFWDNGTDVYHYNDAVYSYDENDILQRILSYDQLTPYGSGDHSRDGDAIAFHLNSTYDPSSSSYSFSGYRNTTHLAQLLHFTHTQCASADPVVFDGGLIEPGHDWSPLRMPTPRDYPRVTARFDNETAALEITGTIGTYTAGRGTGPTSYLGGDVTIRFEGRRDDARSDVLEASHGDGTPVWRATLGVERTLDGDKVGGSASEAAGVRAEWTVGAVLMVGFFVFGGL